MSNRRDHRASKAALLDGFNNIEEGGIRASSSYSQEIDEHSNDTAINSLQDRVSFLKGLTGDIHEEVESHNRLLDRMGNKMDASRGMMSGTIDRFKMVFEKKSNWRMCKLAAYFVVSFFVIYYFISCRRLQCSEFVALWLFGLDEGLVLFRLFVQSSPDCHANDKKLELTFLFAGFSDILRMVKVGF